MKRKYINKYDFFKINENDNFSFLFDLEKEPKMKLPEPKDIIIDEELDLKTTIEDIIRILKEKGNLLKEKIIKQIYLLISKDSKVEEAIIKFLISIGIPEKYANFLTDEVLKYDNSGEFAKYIEKRDVSIKLLMNKKINLVDVFSAKGINKQFLEFLITYRWPSTPAIGPAELALAILLDKARRPSSKEAGDLRIENEPIEIKGTGGRLRGQKGFGDGRAFKKNITTAFSLLTKKFKINNVDLHTDISGVDDTFWNFTGNNWGAEKVAMDIIANAPKGKINSSEIANCVASGIVGIFQKMNEKEVSKRIEPYIKKTGEFDRQGFLKEFAIINFEYYCSQEDFNIMILADDKGNIFAFNKNDFAQHLGKNILVATPNFGDKAGSQGVVFSIKMK